MYDFFRRYNKQLMAIFGVVLMIAFLMPTFQQGQRMSDDRVIGTMGNAQVYQQQVHVAQEEWDFLSRYVVAHAQTTGPNQWQTILAGVPQSLRMSVSENPAAYYLLQQEARQM